MSAAGYVCMPGKRDLDWVGLVTGLPSSEPSVSGVGVRGNVDCDISKSCDVNSILESENAVNCQKYLSCVIV